MNKMIDHFFLRRKIRVDVRTGFTLIELLMVVSLMAIIGLSLFQVLANGLRIWTFTRQLSAEEDVFLFLDRFGEEMRNTYHYSRIPFKAGQNKISFPTVVKTLADRKISSGKLLYIKQMGRVEYSFVEGEIIRRQANYGQAVKDKWSKPRTLVKDVYFLKFIYHYATLDDSQLHEENELPLAVVVQVQLREKTGNIRTIERLVNIPVGS